MEKFHESRLLTDEEIQAVVDGWVNEEFSARYISLSRGHWENIAPIIARAQDTRTARLVAQEIFREIEEHFPCLLHDYPGTWRSLKEKWCDKPPKPEIEDLPSERRPRPKSVTTAPPPTSKQ